MVPLHFNTSFSRATLIVSDRHNWEQLEGNSSSGPVSSGMTHSGSPSAVVKEKDSLGISSHAQCVQIDFKGARDVGRRLGRRLRVTCAWSPPRPASRHQPTGLGPSPESRWISCCKLNMKPGDTWLCAERLSGS